MKKGRLINFVKKIWKKNYVVTPWAERYSFNWADRKPANNNWCAGRHSQQGPPWFLSYSKPSSPRSSVSSKTLSFYFRSSLPFSAPPPCSCPSSTRIALPDPPPAFPEAR